MVSLYFSEVAEKWRDVCSKCMSIIPIDGDRPVSLLKNRTGKRLNFTVSSALKA